MKQSFRSQFARRQEIGSTALEQALFGAAVILAAATAVPRFKSTLLQYLDQFRETAPTEESEKFINADKSGFSMSYKRIDDQKGSLALEQVLFIAAVVTMSVGLFSFYGNIRDYFANISLATPPANIGALSSGGTGNSPNGGN